VSFSNHSNRNILVAFEPSVSSHWPRPYSSKIKIIINLYISIIIIQMSDKSPLTGSRKSTIHKISDYFNMYNAVQEPPKREISLFCSQKQSHSNLISNTKYNILTAIPLIAFNHFKLFLNFYYLLLFISQAIPAMKVSQ